ncbi:dTDP-glucose 4,6-dehydratase [Gracilibacillus alcaliphilus]|uniref:dTDP-glucose 4,6-dehydratase n=1 Tax=Gracilibacillus alcaliphilus TaxID=1401441 RepID=UPI001957CE9B|nr:dTDP-glucose 4,6-dehydratase [Gracilibacillus alcaliphilus]MBM7679429.1 dTDP-glucose 4,6-dehydratase [Gracilibacillus alcaliphilus]
MSKTILITGGAGFIGSNFIHYYRKHYPQDTIINIDKLTYAGSLGNLQEIEEDSYYRFIQGDIANPSFVKAIFAEHNIDGVIHFAAESHVDRSISDSSPFIDTNVVGTWNLIDAARENWQQKEELEQRRFHQISTDEVYGSLGEEGKFTEATPYDPRNPYSASKASANLLVKSYGYTYGMNVVISSCSNNYGPRQHSEKLIPTIIRHALANEKIPIYGDGLHIRDWLYVADHCRAIDLVFHQGEVLETYNVGGDNEQTNINITKKVCKLLDQARPDLLAQFQLSQFEELMTYVKDRQGHDRRYAIDASKLKEAFGWEPTTKLEDGLKQTVDWYVNRWKIVTNP